MKFKLNLSIAEEKNEHLEKKDHLKAVQTIIYQNILL